MKGLVRLMREHSDGAASGTRDRISLEAYLALSVIWIMSLGGNENNDTGITLGGAVSQVGIFFHIFGKAVYLLLVPCNLH